MFDAIIPVGRVYQSVVNPLLNGQDLFFFRRTPGPSPFPSRKMTPYVSRALRIIAVVFGWIRPLFRNKNPRCSRNRGFRDNIKGVDANYNLVAMPLKVVFKL